MLYSFHHRFNTVNGRCYYNLAMHIKKQKAFLRSFNTVNSKYYFLFTFVLPSLRSGTCNVWASSSLRSSVASHSAAHTVNGRCCCNEKLQTINVKDTHGFNTVNGRCCCNKRRPLRMYSRHRREFQYRKR